jgi:hypothetical protein
MNGSPARRRQKRQQRRAQSGITMTLFKMQIAGLEPIIFCLPAVIEMRMT